MDNDNKVIKKTRNSSNVHKEVVVLLENELEKISQDSNRELFDLETEFSKTKKNSFPFMWHNMWLHLIICFGVVFAITLSMMFLVSKSNRSLEVEVSEFENLNLSNLLKEVNGIDQKIKEAESARKAVEEQRKFKIEQIEDSHASALRSLASMNIKDKSVRSKREQEIEANYKADLASIEKYNKEIENYDNDIELYRKQRNEFDIERVQEAERQKAVINSERFIHEKEKEKITEEYEERLEASRSLLKKTQEEDLERQEKLLSFTIAQYDPVLPKDKNINDILHASNNFSETYIGFSDDEDEDEDESSFIPYEADEELSDTLLRQKDFYKAIEILSSQFEQLPFKDENAVSNYIRSMKKYSYTAGNQLVSEIGRLVEEKSEYEKLQEQYNGFLEAICMEPVGKNKVDGIITGFEGFRMVIYIRASKCEMFTDPEYEGYLFPCSLWRGDEKIAIGYMNYASERFYLSGLSYTAGYTVRTGDRIVLEEPLPPEEEEE